MASSKLYTLVIDFTKKIFLLVVDSNWNNSMKHLAFRDRLTMRKYVVTATTDEFFFPDEPTVWWDDMPEPKHLL